MSLLWGSPHDGHDRALLRKGLALVAGVEFLVEVLSVVDMLQDAHYQAAPAVPASALGAWALLIVVLGGLLMVALDRRVVPAGSAVLLAMLGVSLWQTSLFGSPSRNSFFPGAMLFGWVLGQAWAGLLAGKDARGPEGRHFRERIGGRPGRSGASRRPTSARRAASCSWAVWAG